MATRLTRAVSGNAISPAMIAAGLEVLLTSGRLDSDLEASGDTLLVQRIFASMLQAFLDEMQ